MVAISKDMWAVKHLHQQNPPVLNWRCQLTQVDLYNGHKMVVVVVVAEVAKNLKCIIWPWPCPAGWQFVSLPRLIHYNLISCYISWNLVKHCTNVGQITFEKLAPQVNDFQSFKDIRNGTIWQAIWLFLLVNCSLSVRHFTKTQQ